MQRDQEKPKFKLHISLIVLMSLCGGCIPYTVGTTGQPLPAGEKSQAQSLYFIPNGLELFDSTATTFIGYDLELRFGIDGRSDVGLRLPGGMSGAIINYKYRLVGDEGGDSPAVALLTGVGMINWGNHLHFEASLIASGAEQALATPYGGLRAMQVVPVSEGAVSDSPTLGGFLGIRLGDEEFGISPEIGIFYDRSALGLRSHNVIIVPSVTIQTKGLWRSIFNWPPTRR